MEKETKRKTAVRKGERGTAIVEAALVMPVLCLFLAGILEFGRILMVEQFLVNAAREGARAGVVYLDDTTAKSQAQSAAQTYLTRCGLDPALAKLDTSFAEVNGTQALQLSIAYAYSSTLAGWLPSPALELRSLAVMRREA